MAVSPALQPAGIDPRPRETSLLRWVWRSYVRNALIPLLAVELLLVVVYLTSHAWSLRKNVAALSEVARGPQLSGDIGDAEVFLDADKFCQALGNVLANACKYSPAGTPVGVRLVEDEGQVGVEVRDRGEGMDEETQRRIFDRFYRAESTAGVAGSGLGMSIVKEILDIHGGRIEIASLPHEGTTVTLWLPRAAPRG